MRLNDLTKAIELGSGMALEFRSDSRFILLSNLIHTISHFNPKYYNIGNDNMGKRSPLFSLMRSYIVLKVTDFFY